MRTFIFFVVLACRADSLPGPLYNTAGLVNAADSQSTNLSPNTIASLYGTTLAYSTATLSNNDITSGILPINLPKTGLTILIGGVPAYPYYVSPTQLNFLLPANLLPGPTSFQVSLNGLAGPKIPFTLTATSPALFQQDANTAIAAQPDGTVISYKAPAAPGGWVILYANGLGITAPPLLPGQIATQQRPIQNQASFSLSLDGVPVDPAAISYVGAAPGFAGLYQINLQLPSSVNTNPEIRIAVGGSSSIAGIHLPVQ